MGSSGLVVAGVPAARGLRWWSEAMALLFSSLPRTGVWAGMSMAFLVAQLLYWLPFVGTLVSFLLTFLLSGGLMIAAEKTRRGQPVFFIDLFAGFGRHGGALVSASLIVLLACVLVTLLIAFVGAGTVLAAAWDAAVRSDAEAFSAEALSLGWGALAVVLASLLLFTPVFLAAWLAPALIVLRGVNPVDALRLSLAAGGRNFGALTLYGLGGVGVLVLAVMPLLGWLFFFLFFVPLSALSTHAAFCDLFEGGVEVLDAGQTV